MGILVLTRHQHQRVLLETPGGTAVWVSIIEVQGGGRVRLGFEAPEYVSISREEVHDPALTKQRFNLAGISNMPMAAKEEIAALRAEVARLKSELEKSQT
jgi:sRNA-binding carbon storage regulator CsrA